MATTTVSPLFNLTPDASKNPNPFTTLPTNGGQIQQNALMSRLSPLLAQRRQAAEQQWTNQGLVPGGEAYNNAANLLGQSENDAYTQAAMQGLNFDLNAGQQQFNDWLNTQQLGVNATGQNLQGALADASREQQQNQFDASQGQQLNEFNQTLAEQQRQNNISNQNYQNAIDAAQHNSTLQGLFGLGTSIGAPLISSELGKLLGLTPTTKPNSSPTIPSGSLGSISPTTGNDAVLNDQTNPNTSIPSGQAASLPQDAQGPVPLADIQDPGAVLGDLSGAAPYTNGVLGAVPGTSTVSQGLPQLSPTMPDVPAPPASAIGQTAGEVGGAGAAGAGALGLGGGAAAAAGLAPIEAPAAALLGDIGGAVAGAGTSMLGGGVGAGLLGAVPGTSTASAGLAALAPTLPEGFGAPAAAAADTAASGGLGSSLMALATNPITWAAAAIIGGAIIWHKSQSHQTADTWVNGYQNKFDQDMASVSDQFAQLKEQGAVTPEVAQQFRDSAQQLIDAYQTNLSKFYSKGKKEAKVATQAQNTAVQYYGPMYENFLGNFTA